jgi:hypothetical protein
MSLVGRVCRCEGRTWIEDWGEKGDRDRATLCVELHVFGDAVAASFILGA